MFGHTADLHHCKSDAETQREYSWLWCCLRYQVFPGLWLMFRHDWDLQSSLEWGSAIRRKAWFNKLRLILDLSFQPRHTAIVTNMPPKRMYPVYSVVYIFVCFIVIMFSLTFIQWAQFTHIFIDQDTSCLGAGGSSHSASTYLWICARLVCEGHHDNALNCQLCVHYRLEEGSPAELNHKCKDLAN